MLAHPLKMSLTRHDSVDATILIDSEIIIHCGRLVSAPPCNHGLVGPADTAAFHAGRHL